MPTPPRSYSTTEIAQRLGISTQTVQRWVDAGQLKAWKTLGGHRRIEAEGAELLFRLRGKSPSDTAAQDGLKPSQGAGALSVLIVDDNPDDRDILAHMVEATLPAATIAVAPNGFHGLIAIGRTAPDILVTDLLMPYMDGFEMLRQLQTGCAVKPRLIVAVSSNAQSELSVQGELPSGVAFLQKPLDPDLFARTISAGMDESTILDEQAAMTPPAQV